MTTALPTRSQRNAFVMRISVKAGVMAYLLFVVILPLQIHDHTAAVWAVARTISAPFILTWAALTSVAVGLAQWWKPLRMAAGISFFSFGLTYACLAGDWRPAMFALFMSFQGLTLAWTGIPGEDE